MEIICVASKNPVKIQAATNAFMATVRNRKFNFLSKDVDSGVSDQPIGQEEIKRGMMNRLRFAREDCSSAAFCISFEGGLIVDRDGSYYNRAWVGVCDWFGNVMESSSASFRLPSEVEKLVKDGLELGHAIDQTYDLENSKQSGGAVGMFTEGIIDREAYYTMPAIIAISQLKQVQRYAHHKV